MLSGIISRVARTTIIAGIDEAGYGPILGPLVVSAAAFEVPADQADACLWRQLARSVSPKAAARPPKIAIVDSKKLFARKEGLGRLERSVLAVVSAWRGSPPSMRRLLTLLSPQVSAKLDEYDWYRGADPGLPLAADAGAVRILGSLLRADLAARLIRPAGLWSEVLLEGHYNRLVKGTQNKAVVLSGLTLRLVQRIADALPGRPIRFFVDKQGAREHYGRILLTAFEGRRLRIIEERPDHSAYELADDASSWRLSFRQAGESHSLPTALASMISKYVRELLMSCFNAYWLQHVPNLRPTAGYYEDGMRFLKDVRPYLGRLGVRAEDLVRQR